MKTNLTLRAFVVILLLGVTVLSGLISAPAVQAERQAAPLPERAYRPLADRATGFLNPSQNQAISGIGDGNGFEVTPENAYSDDGSVAQSVNNSSGSGWSSRQPDSHQYWGFNFDSIPADAGIEGIEVTLNWWVNSTSGDNRMGVQFSSDGGVNWTPLASNAVGTKEDGSDSTSQSHTATLGGPADTWGRAWSRSDFSSTNFRVRLNPFSQNNGINVSLDWVGVQVTYNTPPLAPILLSPPNQPAPGSYITDNTPLLQWNAATDPDPSDILHYEVRVDGGYWNADPGTATSYTTAPLPQGPHTWQVRAFDGLVYSDPSEPWIFTIDTDTPATPDHIYEGNPDQAYYPSTSYSLPINWGSVPDTGSDITYQVQRRVNGAAWSPDSGPYLYEGADTSFTDSGTFADDTFIEYRVRARTGALVAGGWRYSNGVRIDSMPPGNVTGVGVGYGSTPYQWANNNNFELYWNSVTDTGSGISYEIQKSLDSGVNWIPATTVPSPAIAWNDTDFYSNGDTVLYRMRAVNGAGLTSPAWTTSNNITLDTSFPDSAVTTGGVYATWPGQIRGTATDSGSGVLRVEILIQDSTTLAYWNPTNNTWTGNDQSWTLVSGTTAWYYTLSAAYLTEDHNYSILSRATDVAGNIEGSGSYGSNNFTYSSSAPNAPQPTSPSHPNPAAWYTSRTPYFTWTVPASAVPVAGYSFLLNQYSDSIPDMLQDTTGTTYQAPDTADGTWYFHVRAVNTADTWGPAGHVRVNIDTATPLAPASVTEGDPDIAYSFDGNVDVHWSAVPNTGSGITYELQRCVNGGTCLNEANWVSVLAGIADTIHNDNRGGYNHGDTVRYRVRATNGVGRVGNWTMSNGMTIDRQTPAQPAGVFENAYSEPDTDYVSDVTGAVTVRWTAVANTGSGITYRLARWVNGSLVLTVPGITGLSYADASSYSDGNVITYTITAINGVGTTGLPRASDGITIDLDQPTWSQWVREGVPTDPDWDYYDGVGNLTIYWAPVADTGSGITYRLQKSVDDADWVLVAEGITVTNRTDSNASAPDGARIRYRVTPINGAGTVGPYHLSNGITIDRDYPALPAWVYENNPDVDYDADGTVWVNWAQVATTGSGISYVLEKERSNSGTWTPVTTTLAADYWDSGSYNEDEFVRYRVRACNGVGHCSGGSTPANAGDDWLVSDGFRLDTGIPGAPTNVGEGLVAGTDLAYVNVNTFVVFWTGVSATATGDQIRYTIERNVNGGGYILAATNVTCSTTPCQWDDPSSYSNGDHVAYRITAINGAGTAGPPSAEVPGITMDTGQPNSIIATTGYYNLVSWPNRIEGTASDDYSGVRYVHITIYDTNSSLYWNGTAWVASSTWLTATSTTNWTYALAGVNLTNGHTYNLESRATDNAGNIETSLGINSFTFADQGPQAPVITSSTHPNQAAWYNHNDPAFSWTTVSSVTVSGYSYVLDQNPGTTPAPSVNTTGNSYSYVNVTDGTWYFHVRAFDQAGNWGPAGHYRVNIDTTTPGAPASVTEGDPTPDIAYDLDGSATVYWTAVPNTGSGITYEVSRSVNSGAWTVLSTTVPAVQYYDSSTGYADGTTILYRVSARNGVGLVGPATLSSGFTVDSDAPVTPAWIIEKRAAGDPNTDQAYDPDGLVFVAWAASNNTGSGLTYRLEKRVTTGGFPGNWTSLAEGLTVTSYADPVKYNDDDFIEYRVTAVNGVGNFNPPATSNGIRIDTDTPAAPAGIGEGLASDVGDIDWSRNGSVTVFWIGVDNTGSGITYRLERQVTPSGGSPGAWTLVPGADALPGGTTSFSDSGTYGDGDFIRYHVRATSGAGLSGDWRQSDGMTIDSSAVAAPAWVREENPDIDYDADGLLTVYWAGVADTGSGITYRLQRCVNGGLSGVCTTGWVTVTQGLVGTSYYESQSQPDGTTVRYQVTAFNGVGTAGSPTASDGITVDNQPPGVPAGLGEGDAVGIDDTFDQDNTFWVFWNAVASTGSGITYDIQKSLNGGAWVSATTQVAATSWEDPVPYSNGDTVQYRVRAVNGAGVEGAWSSASSGITLDFAPPDSTVSTSGFYNSFNWPGIIQGTASDNLSDVDFVDIQIQRRSDSYYWSGAAWLAGAAWLRATGTYNWQYALAAANLTDGAIYDLRSRATDNAGNVETTFGANSFTYANSGPGTPTISSPTHSNPANWYNNSNPTFNWITPTSSVRVIGYSYLLDQNATTTPDTQADTAGTTASYPGQADGTWWFHVRAGDNAGNWGPAGHFRINIDTHTPAAPATITEESPDVDWDSDGSVTVYWSAVANTGSGITYRLERNLNNAGWVLVADALATTNYLVGGFANGDTVLFHVRATNGVSLSSGYTQSDGVSFDLTTPQTPTGVGEGDAVGTDDDWDQDNLFFVFWNAVPNTPSGITYSIERNRNNSGVWELMVTGLATTQWDDPTAYSNGESVAYRVTARTGAGRSSAASTPSDGLTLDFVQPDSTINTSGFYNNFTWPGSIQGIASDDRSDVRSVDITVRRQSDSLYWNGTAWGAAIVWLRATGAANWQYTFAPADGQTYNVQSRATDNADNVETTFGTSTFNYSASGPGAPIISSPTHPNETLWYANNAPTFNWITPSSGSGIQGYSYVLDHAPDTEPDLSADTTGNTRSYTGVADGTWYFHVRALDRAGNWGAPDHYQVNIDTTSPAAPALVTEGSPDVDWDADGNITVYWTAVTDLSGVTYTLERSTNGGASWVSVATGITTTSRLDPVTHPDATHLIYHVLAVDSVGLTSPWTQSNGVTIDSETPVQPTGVGEGDVVGADDTWDQDNTFFAFWNAAPNTGSGIVYNIERAISGGAWQVVQTSYAQTFWEDPQIYTDTATIRYRITAVNGVGIVGLASAASSGITLDFTQPDSAIGTAGPYGPLTWPGSITGTAADSTSGVGSVHITLQRSSDGAYWNGATWGSTPVWLLTTGTTAWAYSFAPTDGESYTVQSRATDAAGNVEVTLGVSAFGYTTSEPNSAVSTNGLYVGAGWSGQITGMAYAPMSPLDYVDVTLRRASDNLYFDGAGWIGTPTWLRATGANTWAYSFTPADGATYTVQSRATDRATNIETSFGANTFSYDAAAPVVQTVTVASDRAYLYDPGLTADGGTVYFNSRAGEGAGQTLTVTVTFSEPHPYGISGAPAFGDVPSADTAAPWTVQYSVEANAGTQPGVVFTVSDTLGLADMVTVNFAQDNVAPDSAANIAANATNVSPIQVDWQVSDSGAGVRQTFLWVKYQPLGAWTNTGLVMTGQSGSFAYTPTSGTGTYYFATVAVDNVGNVESTPTGFGDDAIDFDNVPSSSTADAPDYAIVSPIVITWTAAADAKYTYLFYRYGATRVFTQANVPFSTLKNGTFEFEPTHGDGPYYFATVAIDEAGNAEPIAPNGKDLTIYDTQAPTSTATSPAVWTDFAFTVEWAGGDTAIGSGIAHYDMQVKVGNGEWGDWLTHTTSSSAVFTAAYVGQPDATYHFRSRATDKAGHIEDWPTAPEGDTTTLVHFPGSFLGKYKLFLPIIARQEGPGAPQLPDLVVTAISVTPANPSAGQAVDVAVTIKNQGNLATTACFWIDAYINPTRLPITVNKGWFDAGSEGGLVWSLCGLGVGESITLHYNDSHYWPSYSQFSGLFPAPLTYALYAQVDSYNLSTTYGAVYESNEQNNVYGPHPVTVSGAAVTGATWTNAAPLERPDVPPER